LDTLRECDELLARDAKDGAHPNHVQMIEDRVVMISEWMTRLDRCRCETDQPNDVVLLDPADYIRMLGSTGCVTVRAVPVLRVLGGVEIQVTEEELDLMKHAVGHERGKPFYRNYFCADPGSNDDRIWTSLTERGLAVLRRGPQEHLPYNLYVVSFRGLQLL
jgi:hypothetical protein